MCGIGERVDRRPIDPPPVVQIVMNSTDEASVERLSTLSSHLFLIAVLIPADGREDQEQLNILLHSKLTVGRTVSSLYTLRDLDGMEGAFFVFSDISVRAEGNYKLRMCLFDIREHTVNYNLSVLTEPFTVYSAKTFPGMYRSCPLVQSFAKQGLKIRIRKESGPRPSRYVNLKRKTIRKAISTGHVDNKHNTMIESTTIKDSITPLYATTGSEDELDEYELDEDEDDEDDESQQLSPSRPVENKFKPSNLTHLLSPQSEENTIDTRVGTDYHNHNLSAFKRVHTETDKCVSTKRRLSLSYLLDQNENLPHNTTPLISEECRLAPISIISNNSHSSSKKRIYPQEDMKIDSLPPIQHSFNPPKIPPFKQEDLPPIQNQLPYFDKR
ncbi:velvet factor-domain-containing protein [Parasitella parasitica]|nr:velvet factor-domain-containing protein [Parasitella parasitica]